MSVGNWTGLDVVKLLVSALIPLAVVYAGYRVSRAASRLEAVQWANQPVIQRRLDIFAEVAPKLNQLLCFALFIGGWKDITPTGDNLPTIARSVPGGSRNSLGCHTSTESRVGRVTGRTGCLSSAEWALGEMPVGAPALRVGRR